MLDKNLIKKNFTKSLKTYDNNALIQKKTAAKLISIIQKKQFENILEVGSFSGVLTKEAIKNLTFENYLAVDIIDSYSCIKDLSDKISFKNVDIESFNTEEKFDLIISNAALQWCEDFFTAVKKLKSYLKKGGLLAICVFGKKNLIEIKETFNSSLLYYCEAEIKEVFPAAEVFEEIETLNFDSPAEILRHLKLTGVNSLSQNKFRISQLKVLENKFHNRLTYNPLYIIIRA